MPIYPLGGYDVQRSRTLLLSSDTPIDLCYTILSKVVQRGKLLLVLLLLEDVLKACEIAADQPTCRVVCGDFIGALAQ